MRGRQIGLVLKYTMQKMEINAINFYNECICDVDIISYFIFYMVRLHIIRYNILYCLRYRFVRSKRETMKGVTSIDEQCVHAVITLFSHTMADENKKNDLPFSNSHIYLCSHIVWTSFSGLYFLGGF